MSDDRVRKPELASTDFVDAFVVLKKSIVGRFEISSHLLFFLRFLTSLPFLSLHYSLLLLAHSMTLFSFFHFILFAVCFMYLFQLYFVLFFRASEVFI